MDSGIMCGNEDEKIICPQCQKEIKGKVVLEGMSVICPNCGAPI